MPLPRAVLLPLLVLLVSQGAPPGALARSVRPAAAAAVDDLLEQVRRVIREGDPELGLPPLDPFTIAFLNGSLETEDHANAVEGELRDVQVTGLADFDASLDVSVGVLPPALRVGAAITVPLIRLTTGYGFVADLRLNGKDVQLYGDDTLRIDVENIELQLDLSISVLTLKVRSLKISINIRDIQVEVRGLLEGGLVDQLVSSVASELAMELFNEKQAALEEAAATALLEPLQSALDSVTLDDLLCLLGVCSDKAVLQAIAKAQTMEQ